LLSSQALTTLKKFCEKFSIISLDFDLELPKLLQHDLDKKIYVIAKQEMHHQGGVLAAASDCVRTLIPVIEQFGIYSDFDVGLEFAEITKQISIKYPVVLPVDYQASGPSVNFDFVAVAHVGQDAEHLHPDAIECIQKIQKSIITRYANPLRAFVTPNFRGLGTAVLMDPMMHGVISGFFQVNPSATIFDLRAYCKTANAIHRLSTPQGWMCFSQQDSRKLSHHILFHSVLLFSGANAFSGIYEKQIPAAGFLCGPRGIQPSTAWNSLLRALEHSSLEANQLRKAVITRNNMSAQYLTEAQAVDLGIRDASWGPVGKEKKQEREQKIFAAANTIASAWKKKKGPPSTGLGRMSSLVISSIFNPQSLPQNLPREIKEELSKNLEILKITP
jgi:hypothetical protein